MNAELEKILVQRYHTIESLKNQVQEMRNLYEKAQAGKDKELRDLGLVFFAEKKEIVERYNSLVERSRDFKIHVQKEIEIKEEIID